MDVWKTTAEVNRVKERGKGEKQQTKKSDRAARVFLAWAE